MSARPAPQRRVFRRADERLSTGEVRVQEDSVRGVAGFLADAARGGASTRTVVQVLQHWLTEGVTYDELHAAIAHARDFVARGHGQDHEERLERYEKAIRGGLVMPSGCQQS